MNSNHEANENRVSVLASKLKSFYGQYDFSFEVEYFIYNQEVQIYSFWPCTSQNRGKYMLTFNSNPGDVIWNLQSIDKRSITELLRVHNRTSGTKNYSQSLFRGRDFFEDRDARVISRPRRFDNRQSPKPIDSPAKDRTPTTMEIEYQNKITKTDENKNLGQKKILVREALTDKQREEGRAGKVAKIAKFDNMLSRFKEFAEGKGWIRKK